MSSKVSSLRDIESGVNEFKCSDRVHDLLGLLRVGHQATTLRGAGHQSLLFLNFPCRVAGASDDCITGTRWKRAVSAESPGSGPPIIHLSSSSSGVWQRHSFSQSTPHCPVPTEAALGHVGQIQQRIYDFISNKLSRYDLNHFRRGIRVAVAWLHTTISSVHDSGPAVKAGSD